MEIVDAIDGDAFLLRLAEGWQQHAGQDRNDGDDHQQFDQRKGVSPVLSHITWLLTLA
jgi:hypothetical protein